MRVFQALISPLGAFGLTLLALTLAFVALVLDQADIKSPTLVWVFGISACVTFLGAIAVFVVAFLGPKAERSRAQIRELRRYFWLLGGPVLCGLLLGGMEWLISTSLFNALGIGAAAYALAQLGFMVWAVRLTRAQEQIPESGELQRLRGEVDSLQQRLATYNADFDMYWKLLVSALEEGHSLREAEPSEEDARKWADQLYGLLEAAEGKWRADIFRKSPPGYVFSDLDATGQQPFLDYRLSRLEELMQLVKSGQNIKLRSGFDPHEWKDWKSPPQTDGN